MRQRLSKLQKNNKKARKLRSKKLPENLKDIKEVLYYQGFFYIPKIIYSELISRHHDNPLVGNFEIEKT